MLLDGWGLVYAPGQAAAMHLLELLETLPARIEPWVALPVPAGLDNPQKLFGDLPVICGDGDEAQYGPDSRLEKGVRLVYSPAPDTPASRMRWEQIHLPRLAGKVQARRIHLLGQNAPLFSPAPISISPADDIGPPARADGFASRLRSSLGRGGTSQAQAILWPGDLPYPNLPVKERRVSPYAHSAFRTAQPRPDVLPENYVLVPGALDAAALRLLAAAWSWAAAGLGDEWSLLVCDLDQAGEVYLRSLFSQSGTAPLLAFSPARLPKERAALFQYSGVVLSLGAVQAWGDVLLQALTSGRPLIGEETPLVSARVGPAAYLVTPGDARGLGAALITVLIEPDLSEQLCLAAQKRAQGWSDGIDFPTRLDELF